MADFEVIFTNVGQGDCTLIRLPGGEYMLVDVYRCPDNGIDIFKLLDGVLPDNGDGRKRLKYLVVTHAHDDHITGIGDLYDRYAVEWLWLPQHEDRKQIAKHFGEYQRITEEHPEDKIYRPQGGRSPLDVELGDGVTLRCFSPPGYIEIDESLTEEEAKKLVHENCLVMRLCYEGVSVLLTGDSDVACWKRVVDYYEGRTDDQTSTEVLDSTVLHASHHGSRTFIKDGGEDSEAWLNALEIIAPETIVVSVGEDNRHGHPHADMMAAYRDQAGTDNVYETCQTGTIVLEIDAGGSFRVILDNGRYAEDYGWDDEDNGDHDDTPDTGSGGGSAMAIVAGVAAAGVTAAAIAKRRRVGSRTRLDDEPAA